MSYTLVRMLNGSSSVDTDTYVLLEGEHLVLSYEDFPFLPRTLIGLSLFVSGYILWRACYNNNMSGKCELIVML